MPGPKSQRRQYQNADAQIVAEEIRKLVEVSNRQLGLLGGDGRW
jgi:hypothetical protein